MKTAWKLLALDTSTEVMSVAVSHTVQGQSQVWQHTEAGGARASTGLIPLVLDLLQQAGLALHELDAICFGSGPGSFTGLRTACSVAQGLGFGAGVPLLGVNSLLAIAEEARTQVSHPGGMASGDILLSLLDARMDEVYAAPLQWSGQHWEPLGDSRLLRPEALEFPDLPGPVVGLAGNAFAVGGARLPQVWQTIPQVECLPTAAAMLRLAPHLLQQGQAVPAAQALPAYIRDKVAQTTAERMAAKRAVRPQP